jgi:exosortase
LTTGNDRRDGAELRNATGSGGATPRGTLAARQLARFAVAAVLVAIVYYPVFPTLWRTWMSSPNYSHGFLIPPIVLFLLWRERKRFVDAVRAGTAWGIAIIALALVGNVVSIRAGIFMTQGYSFVLMLFGLSLFFFGGRATRVIWFPLAFLVFMLPWPPFLMNVLSFNLKVFAARSGSALAAKLGVPLVRSGMTIHVPAGSLRIADPCSGLRSLIALVALGTLFAYLTAGAAWKRLVIVAVSVPLAIAGNMLRITALCLVAHVWGIDAALGFFHDFSGFLLFMFAFVGLVVVRKLLRCETCEGEETAPEGRGA